METFSNLWDQRRTQSAGVRALRHRRSSYIRGHLPGVPDECETKNESPNRNSVLPVEPTPTPKPDLEMIVVKGLVVRECENLTPEEHRLVSRVPRGDLKVLQKEQDPYIQFEILRAIPGGLPAKKVIRTKLAVNPVKVLSGFQAWKYKRRLGFRKFMLSLSELRDRLEIWGYWFKKIEGEFGNGVLSYFKFLKWLWKLNIYIFLLVTLFIVIPQGVFKEDPDYSEVAGNISDARINETLHCSALYKVDTDNGFVQVILDFIQGTGWMEKTPMFYGEYSDRQLSIGETSYKYNMPLAYFCLTLVYFTLSLVLMCRQTRATLREQIVQNQYTTRILGYANIVFGGWDFTLSAEKSALMRQKALFYEIRSILEDSRHRARRETRSVFTKCKLYLIRVIINLIVFSMLGGAGYLIYFATMKSTELKNIEDYEQLNRFVQLLYEFIPSLTITGLNAIIPLFFTKIVKGEDYSPDFEIRMTLGRTVFLRLASVAVLLATLYYQITCTPVDECNVGTGECTQLRCWETFFGQQIYRLIIVSFAAKIGIILCVEFPRRIIVSVFKFKLTEMVGRQEFDIPKQVLDIVYNQTLCWLATFFAPLTPVIFVIGCPLIFYLMVATTLINYVPAKKPYRSSKAHIFFMMVLITAFILCCVPIGYCIWQVRPSIGCGPFRLYDDIYDILTITIDTSWPQILQDIVHFFTSAGFLVALFVILILIIYYYQSAASGRSEMIELLREQITIESRDKQFLLGRLTELGGAGQNKKNDKEKKQESKSDSKSNGQTSYNSMEETEPLSKHF